jgi:hypothetical protein
MMLTQARASSIMDWIDRRALDLTETQSKLLKELTAWHEQIHNLENIIKEYRETYKVNPVEGLELMSAANLKELEIRGAISQIISLSKALLRVGIDTKIFNRWLDSVSQAYPSRITQIHPRD